MIAIVEGLLQIGGSKERQLLRFVGDDPRTIEKLRAFRFEGVFPGLWQRWSDTAYNWDRRISNRCG